MPSARKVVWKTSCRGQRRVEKRLVSHWRMEFDLVETVCKEKRRTVNSQIVDMMHRERKKAEKQESQEESHI